MILLFCLLLWLYLHLFLISDISLCYPIEKKFKHLFPKPLEYGKYVILNVQMEQSGLPKNAIIHVFSELKNAYQLWSILPFSVSPPPQLLYQSSEKFVWGANDALNLVIVSTGSVLKVFEQTEMKKGKNSTLGSWHQRQVFSLEASQQNVSITVSPEADMVFLHLSASGLFILNQINDEDNISNYMFDKVTMDQVHPGFSLYPRSIVTTRENQKYLVTGFPLYKQTDGIVDIYTVEDQKLNLCQSLSPPHPASCFGQYCLVTKRPKDQLFLLVSAPFAPNVETEAYGKGRVYIYKYEKHQFQLYQLVSCPTAQECYEFGGVMDVSQDGQWLAISGKTRNTLVESRTIYIYSFINQYYQYVHNITTSSPVSSDFGKCLSIDNRGTLLLSDTFHVYCSFQEHMATK